MGWAADRRLDYIAFRLVTAGVVRRTDVERTFGVHAGQVYNDLREFDRQHPGVLVYDKHKGLYHASSPQTGLRRMTAAAVAHLQALHGLSHPMGWE